MTTGIHVAVCVALQDAGEATRGLALTRALRDHCPADRDLRVTFVSAGGRFEPMIREAGFEIVRCDPPLAGHSIAEDLQWRIPEFVGSGALASSLIDGQKVALEALAPDAVLHGWWPFASLAARLLRLPTIAFLPLPLSRTAVAGGLFADLPDETPVLSRLPEAARRRIAGAAAPLMTRLPVFRQRALGAGAAASGWPVTGALSLFDALRADLTLVNDLPEFYRNCPIPDGFHLTGPVFADNSDAAHDGAANGLDPAIAEALTRDGRPAVLLTMGSSGTAELFLEAVSALAGSVDGGPPPDWNTVVLAAPAVCPIAEARAAAGDNPRVLVTDRFIPARAAHRLTDVLVSHGGQGTVQTALAAGTPIVGIGMQPEQQINLGHLAAAGAGIRIQRHRWRAPVIRRAVRTVLTDERYRRNAATLADTMRTMDGTGRAADLMWSFLIQDHPGGSTDNVSKY